MHKHISELTNNIFADMWKFNGRMVFDDSYDTAAIGMYAGKIRISVNRKFWKRSSIRQRVHLICHEFLHLMFGHVTIEYQLSNKEDAEWRNIAQDIQVNEYLLKNFPQLGVKRGATIKSVFRHKAKLVEKDRDYLYYYGLIKMCLV